MPTWRCPHCGTPQTETARCWVCRRSSTACGTCRHFRRSVAKNVGYCGLDRRRAPLVGDEILECWTARPSSSQPFTEASHADPSAEASMTALPHVAGAQPRRTDAGAAPDATTPVARRDFVEVGAAPIQPAPGTPGRAAGPAADPDVPAMPVVGQAGEPRWSLWGDLDG